MKHRNSLVVVVLCVAMLLAACGGRAEEAASSSPASSEAEVTSSPASAQETETPAAEETSEAPAAAPLVKETTDGWMSSFLSSERDLIGTANEYGDYYRVVYETSLAGNELTASGAMDFRAEKDGERSPATSDETHVFKVDEHTVYQIGGEESTQIVSMDEFAEYLDDRKGTGMYFEVEIRDGVVATAILFAQ